MCTITINPASVSATSAGAGATIVTLSGTVTNCTSNSITVQVSCPASAPGSAPATITGTTWTATVQSKCGCGTVATITATCHDTPPCTATFSGPLVCNCCPQITSNTVNYGAFNNSGQQSVTFVTTMTFPAGCVVTVQRDFGDGNFGTPHTFSSSPASFTDSHLYAGSAGYGASLIVLSQPSCGPTGGTTVTVLPPPPCSTSSFLAAFCNLLQFLFLLFGSAASALLLATFSPACLALNNALPGVVGGMTLTALISLALAYLLCRKCVCAFLLKRLSQLVFMTGLLLIMYIALPVCTQPVPFPTPLAAMGASLLLILIGGIALLYGSWYGQNRYVCPLTICDYWQAVKEALTIAILAAFLVFGSLAGGVILSALGLCLLVISLLLTFTNQQILINQNQGNC